MMWEFTIWALIQTYIPACSPISRAVLLKNDPFLREKYTLKNCTNIFPLIFTITIHMYERHVRSRESVFCCAGILKSRTTPAQEAAYNSILDRRESEGEASKHKECIWSGHRLWELNFLQCDFPFLVKSVDKGRKVYSFSGETYRCTVTGVRKRRNFKGKTGKGRH